MKIKISKLKNLSERYLSKLGVSKEISTSITKNLVDATLASKKTHGFIRLRSIKKEIEDGNLNLNIRDLQMETKGNLLKVNANNLPAYYPYYISLVEAIRLADSNPIVLVTLKDLGYASGYIGSYALLALERELVFLGFNNSPANTIPFGSTEKLWGTNPVTIGIPTKDVPFLFDAATTKISGGAVLAAINDKKKIPEGVAFDSEGNPTLNPTEVAGGGLLPIAEHKGSGLAFSVELLAGALAFSKIGKTLGNSWGAGSYILINPSLLGDLSRFKENVNASIKELKEAKRAPGIEEVFYPGEQSLSKYVENLENGYVNVKDKYINTLNL